MVCCVAMEEDIAMFHKEFQGIRIRGVECYVVENLPSVSGQGVKKRCGLDSRGKCTSFQLINILVCSCMNLLNM